MSGAGELPSALLVVDKPSGPTSHDAVARVRRALGTRSVGHAGTLDPMASGVLLILVGECTKLSRFLTLESKTYRAVVQFGLATDTLDAQGRVVAQAPVPDALVTELAALEQGRGPGEAVTRALAAECARTMQTPPAYSAIKQGGAKAYERARRGEAIDLKDRPVQVESMRVLGASAERCELQLELSVSKGYYVRALARDLGLTLGVPCHLVALRRTRIGTYRIEEAVGLDQPERYVACARTLSEAARAALPCVVLTESGVRRALWGQALMDEDFETAPGEQATAWLDSAGNLVAVGDRSAGRPTILRAFSHPAVVC